MQQAQSKWLEKCLSGPSSVNVLRNINVSRNSPFWTQAICENNQDKVVELLQKGQDIEARDSAGATGLMLACQHGPRSIVRLLISKNANVNACDDTGNCPITYAVVHGHVKIAKYLVKYGAKVEVGNIYF